MPKLKTLKPSINTIRPLLSMPKRDQQRDAVQPWRHWYKTSRWQKLRMQILVRALFTCQMAGCGRVEGKTSQLVADHRIPHRGNEGLFWDADNLQCLCKPCHDRLKQRQEIRERFQSQGGRS
jgi:5-methylcytosine-specific restriction endonuclease McrA